MRLGMVQGKLLYILIFTVDKIRTRITRMIIRPITEDNNKTTHMSTIIHSKIHFEESDDNVERSNIRSKKLRQATLL